MANDFFTAFWNNRDNPQAKQHSGEKMSMLYSQEINILLQKMDYEGGAVFETGCADGALFEFLNINKVGYKGIDLSQSMVDIFKSKYPEINASAGDGSRILSEERKYGLVFNTGVCQYFNPHEMRQYIIDAKNILNKNGIILLVNIPHTKDRYSYYSRYFSNKILSFKSRLAYIYLGLMSPLKIHEGPKTMGYWYSIDFFKTVAKELNLHLEIFGSINHPYRISIGLKKNS